MKVDVKPATLSSTWVFSAIIFHWINSTNMNWRIREERSFLYIETPSSLTTTLYLSSFPLLITAFHKFLFTYGTVGGCISKAEKEIKVKNREGERNEQWNNPKWKNHKNQRIELKRHIFCKHLPLNFLNNQNELLKFSCSNSPLVFGELSYPQVSIGNIW